VTGVSKPANDDRAGEGALPEAERALSLFLIARRALAGQIAARGSWMPSTNLRSLLETVPGFVPGSSRSPVALFWWRRLRPGQAMLGRRTRTVERPQPTATGTRASLGPAPPLGEPLDTRAEQVAETARQPEIAPHTRRPLPDVPVPVDARLGVILATVAQLWRRVARPSRPAVVKGGAPLEREKLWDHDREVLARPAEAPADTGASPVGELPSTEESVAGPSAKLREAPSQAPLEPAAMVEAIDLVAPLAARISRQVGRVDYWTSGGVRDHWWSDSSVGASPDEGSSAPLAGPWQALGLPAPTGWPSPAAVVPPAELPFVPPLPTLESNAPEPAPEPPARRAGTRVATSIGRPPRRAARISELPQSRAPAPASPPDAPTTNESSMSSEPGSVVAVGRSGELDASEIVAVAARWPGAADVEPAVERDGVAAGTDRDESVAPTVVTTTLEVSEEPAPGVVPLAPEREETETELPPGAAAPEQSQTVHHPGGTVSAPGVADPSESTASTTHWPVLTPTVATGPESTRTVAEGEQPPRPGEANETHVLPTARASTIHIRRDAAAPPLPMGTTPDVVSRWLPASGPSLEPDTPRSGPSSPIRHAASSTGDQQTSEPVAQRRRRNDEDRTPPLAAGAGGLMATGAAPARQPETPREVRRHSLQSDPRPSSAQEEQPTTASPATAPPPLLGWLARRHDGVAPLMAAISAEEPTAPPAAERQRELVESPSDRPDEPSDAELARVIMSLPPVMAEAAIAAGVLGADRTVVPPKRTAADVSPGPTLVEGHPAAASIASDPSIRRFAEAPGMVLAPLGGGWHGVSQSGWQQPSVATTLTAGLADAPADRGLSAGSTGVASLRTSRLAAFSGGSRSPIQLASTDRPEPGDDNGSSVAGGGQPPTATAGAADDDQDQLVEEVFQRLRWRLLAERERQLSWG
jgi:hypothetical protein